MIEPMRCVYVHAPFCARRCAYCDFAVSVAPTGDTGAWTEALARELAHLGLEWTAEAKPESFDGELAGRWREAGVNRISLGVQSFHEPTLRWMGRLHGPEGAVRAVETAKKAGFDNISVDLIFGLPPQVGRSWEADLDRALALDVPHVSLYGLSVEPRTPLGRSVDEGREPAVDEEQYRDEYLLAAERLRGAGYEHYEVSNFAREGLVSRHNSAYWDGRPYLGLGNGAHSYRHPVRRWNPRDWGVYQERVLRGASPEERRELLTADETAMERIWLALRTSPGLGLAGLTPAALEVVRGWEPRGLSEVGDGRVRLTPLGWLELDGLTVELDALRSGG
jgi:oxygen-independent coproporphyrinogen-3 oxidase